MTGVRRLTAVLATAATVAGTLTAVTVLAAPAGAAPAGGSFTPVTQHRVVSGATLTGGNVRTVSAADLGVPDSAADVVGTITVAGATTSGNITAYGSGTAPGTTNLQFVAQQVASDTVVVPLSNGAVSFKDLQATGGTVKLYLDVMGYYAVGGTSSDPGNFVPTSPTRVADTRSGLNTQQGAIAAGHTAAFTVGGAGGIPASGVGTVAVTITASGPTATGSLTAYSADDTTHPSAPTSYFAPVRGNSAFALVPVSDAGSFDVWANTKGTEQVVVDAVGWFPPGAALDQGAFTNTPPERMYTSASVGAYKTVATQLLGRGGVPLAQGSTALLTLIAGARSASGHITAWPSAAPRPVSAAVQWVPGLSGVGQVPVQVGSNGYVDFYNASSTAASLSVDLHGYTAATAITPPTVSVARYLNDLQTITNDTDLTVDEHAMETHGEDDATQQPNFVLLDVGAQTRTDDSANNPDPDHVVGPDYAERGVTLAATDPSAPPVRIRYTDLLRLIDAYIDGFLGTSQGATTTIAVGTNNDGASASTDAYYYPLSNRGADWANALIDPVQAYANTKTTHVTVSGALDAEAAFSATEAQTLSWENGVTNSPGYLSQTSSNLVYNGDANSCPTTFDSPGKTCAFGWTEAQYYALAHNGSRISVLPQIFYPAEAVKWANIDATGSGGSKNELDFVGSLTQHARDDTTTGTTLAADAGWAALNRSLSTLTLTPSLPRSVALLADPTAPPNAKRDRAILSH